MSHPKTPFVPPELVAWLETIYPDRCPALTTPDRDIWFAAGQAQVVRKLHQMVEHQQQNILET